MEKIDYIQKSVQDVAEAIKAVLSIDVTVINTELVRIAATGKYINEIGKKLPQGCYYDEILKNKNNEFVVERLKGSNCLNCKSVDSCEELATIGYPILSRNGKILGVMGLIAFKEEEREYIYTNFESINKFLEKLGILLAGNLIYEKTIGDLSLKNQEMTNLINSLDYGVIFTDENKIIKKVNNVALELLNTNFKDLHGKNIDEIFNNINNIDKNSRNILPIKSKLNNLEDEYMVRVVINKVGNEIKSYLFEISKYSKALKDAYDILESNERVSFEDILGESYVLQSTINLAKQVSISNSSVMIRGESGTGKELFARAIHNQSPRKNNMFIAINCASIPENLLESELFGYEKGAFTDANKSGKIGRFELANGGTLFLDEIGDLPIHLQPKLLRVLQDGSFTRLGGNKKINVNFRLITATNRNLEEMIKNEEFREDLYYRLNVIPINIPPLRERTGDIPIIAQKKLENYCVKLNKSKKTFSDELLEIFCNYKWMGNIRELENIIEYLVNISRQEIIGKESLPRHFNYMMPEEVNRNSLEDFLEIETDKSLKDMTERFEKNILKKYLESFGESTTSKKEIAKKLDMDLSTLYRKLYRYGII